MPLGDTALISYEACTGDLNTLSPWIYQWGIPVFFNNSSDNSVDEVIQNALFSFRKVLLVGGDEQLSNILEEALHHKNVSTTRLMGDGPFNANIAINSWLDTQYKNNGIKRSKNLVRCV